MSSNTEILNELYSSDNSHISYFQEQLNTINILNSILLILYYVILGFYIYYIFRTIRYGPNRKLTFLLICGLIAYPFVIYRVEQFIFDNVTTLFDKVYYQSLE
mgnify:CR=1 FL=1|jgi:hypothetical protein